MSKDETGQQALLESGAGLQTNLSVSASDVADRQAQTAAEPTQDRQNDSVSLPTGVVMHIEKSRPHEEFMWAARPDWVLLKIDFAQRLLGENETADSWTPPETQVVTTSTIRDEKLAELSVEQEVDIVNEFQPAAHVGGDVPVYQEWKPYRRVQGLRRLMVNAAWLQAHTRDEVTIIPLVKGETTRERELVYDSLDVFDHNCLAYYATQYFTGGTGVELDTVITQLDAIATETAELDGQSHPNTDSQAASHAQAGGLGSAQTGTVKQGGDLGSVKSDPQQWQDSMLSDGGSPTGDKPVSDTTPHDQRTNSDGGEIFVIGCVSQRLADVERGIRATAGLNAWRSRLDPDCETPVTDQYETVVETLQADFDEICSP